MTLEEMPNNLILYDRTWLISTETMYGVTQVTLFMFLTPLQRQSSQTCIFMN